MLLAARAEHTTHATRLVPTFTCQVPFMFLSAYYAFSFFGVVHSFSTHFGNHLFDYTMHLADFTLQLLVHLLHRSLGSIEMSEGENNMRG